MIKDYYFFKKPLITKGIEFYKNNRIRYSENIKTYKDFAEMISEKFSENSDGIFGNEFFLEAIEYEAEMGWNEILKKCLASILKAGLSEMNINEDEEITDAKLIELLRELEECKYVREFEMLEDWINEDLSEIADSVFESLLEAKKDNPELDITDSEVIENERFDYANELDYPEKDLKELDKLIKYKVEN